MASKKIKRIPALFVNKTSAFKGQLISKWFFGVVDFLQKTNENKSTWGLIVVKSNLFVHSLEEIDDPHILRKTILKLSDLYLCLFFKFPLFSC